MILVEVIKSTLDERTKDEDKDLELKTFDDWGQIVDSFLNSYFDAVNEHGSIVSRTIKDDMWIINIPGGKREIWNISPESDDSSAKLLAIKSAIIDAKNEEVSCEEVIDFCSKVLKTNENAVKIDNNNDYLLTDFD